MSDVKPSPDLKGVRYAEDELSVHKIFEEAVDARKNLDGILTNLASMRDKRRDIEDGLRSREMELAGDEWGRHPDFSATKMEGHLKTARHNDFAHTALRGELNQIASDIDDLENDKAIAETDIKIAVARMTELGGYFNYLAAIKQSQLAREAREA